MFFPSVVFKEAFTQVKVFKFQLGYKARFHALPFVGGFFGFYRPLSFFAQA
jgi:hypothetical protein